MYNQVVDNNLDINHKNIHNTTNSIGRIMRPGRIMETIMIHHTHMLSNRLHLNNLH